MATRDPNDWMWERAAELLERTAWVQRRFFQVAHERGTAWEPPVDVFESPSAMIVLVALPGVDVRTIETRCEGSTLFVSARRALPGVCEEADVRRLEIPQGRFQRRVELAGVKVSFLRSDFQDGLLVIHLGKVT